MLTKVRRFFAQPEIKYILTFFLATRFSLLLLGLLARYATGVFSSPADILRFYEVFQVWDSGWYLQIASGGYSAATLDIPGAVGQATYAFFPLYPLLMNLLGSLLGGNFALAGFLISNTTLFIACVYFYKLVQLLYDEATSRKAIKYLLLFPTAFIFSGIFTESLFLMLLVMTLYYSKQRRWLLAAGLGYLLSATRVVGLLVIIPVVLDYLEARGVTSGFARGTLRETFKTLKLNTIIARLKKLNWQLFLFGIIPLGYFTFMLYIYSLTGDLFAVSNVQAGWGRSPVNPLVVLVQYLFYPSLTVFFGTSFTLICYAILVFGIKKVNLRYWILGALLATIPLLNSSDPYHINSVPRYLLVVFPLYIIAARLLTKRKQLDEVITIGLILLQGILMTFWTLSYGFVV